MDFLNKLNWYYVEMKNDGKRRLLINTELKGHDGNKIGD